MMDGRRADDGSHGQGMALKRRGILAAAGAVLAAVVARQASTPVAAASPGTGSQVALILQSNGLGSADQTTFPNMPNVASAATDLDASVNFGNYSAFGPYIFRADARPSNTGNIDGLEGYGRGTGNGVLGQSTDGYGVQGQSTNSIGVFGATNGTGLVAGLYGTSSTAYGIIGNTTASGYSGLTAITGTAGVAALAATSTNASAFAAYFQGTTVVQGNFIAFGGGKSAAVPDASGQHRLVYCVESPEAWFEDFGKAKLVNGRADVRLDPDFAAIVHADDYHVFLTAYGNTNGLHVTRQGAGGFTVEEHNGGTGGVTFSYRVVAKRKDIVGERLAKFSPPKINHPDPDKLPKLEPIPPSPPPRKP